ncbi:MAG: nucleoside hydrolase, partial [Acholeplasmatales bacterium]|nr:nucleoside hydrolase [Acholeplasmatales bacterium]
AGIKNLSSIILSFHNFMEDKFLIPANKKVRVIVDTDAKNEVDDQFAIVQAALSDSFEIKGFIAAHFGTEKSPHSMQDSYDEIKKVLKLINKDDINVYHGSIGKIDDINKPEVSDGVKLIIDEALKDDDRPLYIAFLGAITDMANALLMNPEIANRNIKVIWIGGRDYPNGGWEYNLKNDIIAANIVFNSKVELSQVPRNVYRMMPVSHAELLTKVYPYGEIGKYLASNVIEFNNIDIKRPAEYRVLGDSPAIGIIMYEDAGEWEYKKAPSFNPDMTYNFNNDNRLIKVYKNINSRFILEDLYAKLKLNFS